MNNPFSLKKEVPKSYFKAATMIVQKDLGKGKSKKFLFDHNACEALKIDENTCIAFIVNPPHLFLADISHIDKDKWGIGEQEFNLFNKNAEYLDMGDNRYKFRTFSNSALYNVLIEEYELSRDFYNIYSLSIISKQDFSLFLDEESCKMMERMEIDTLYNMELFDSLSSFDYKPPGKFNLGSLEEYLQKTTSASGWVAHPYGADTAYYKPPKLKRRPLTKGEVGVASLSDESDEIMEKDGDYLSDEDKAKEEIAREIDINF